jgi:hypothetical protein
MIRAAAGIDFLKRQLATRDGGRARVPQLAKWPICGSRLQTIAGNAIQ